MVIVERIFLIVDRYRNMFPGKDLSCKFIQVIESIDSYHSPSNRLIIILINQVSGPIEELNGCHPDEVEAVSGQEGFSNVDTIKSSNNAPNPYNGQKGLMKYPAFILVMLHREMYMESITRLIIVARRNWIVKYFAWTMEAFYPPCKGRTRFHTFT